RGRARRGQDRPRARRRHRSRDRRGVCDEPDVHHPARALRRAAPALPPRPLSPRAEPAGLDRLGGGPRRRRRHGYRVARSRGRRAACGSRRRAPRTRRRDEAQGDHRGDRAAVATPRRRAARRRFRGEDPVSALLALDTSTEWASVAIFDGTAVLAEETWHAQRRHAEDLFPTIERLLALSRQQINTVDKVAVATGPGSFTGLRVAIAAAQGLARGSGAALVGVSTLDVLAYPHASSKLRTCPLLPAGRGEYYAALYQERNRKWARRSPFIVGSLV